MIKRDYKRYGITPEQWDRMFEKQEGRCPICERPILRPGNKEGKRAASVDHDHRTKRVRGLLHYRCNRFAVSRNTVERAKRVYEYLASDFDGRKI